jgi:hypothetical protein
LFSAKRRKERNEYDQQQEILGKVNSHIVAEEFASEIFEEQPTQKKIRSVSPVIKDRHNDGAAKETQAGVSESGHIVADNILGGFVSGESPNYEGAEEQQRAPSELARRN